VPTEDTTKTTSRRRRQRRNHRSSRRPPQQSIFPTSNWGCVALTALVLVGIVAVLLAAAGMGVLVVLVLGNDTDNSTTNHNDNNNNTDRTVNLTSTVPSVSPTTLLPSFSPTTTSPTTTPSTSPSVPPTTTRPSKSPSTAPTTAAPTLSPTIPLPDAMVQGLERLEALQIPNLGLLDRTADNIDNDPYYRALEWLTLYDGFDYDRLTTTTENSDDDDDDRLRFLTTTNDTDDNHTTTPIHTSLSAADATWVQRYILAVTYYALNGPSWPVQHQFLSNRSICDWHTIDPFDTKVGCYCIDSTMEDENDNNTATTTANDNNNSNNTTTITFLHLDLRGQYYDATDNTWRTQALTGVLPPEVFLLPHLALLRTLYASHNFTAVIPTFVGDPDKSDDSDSVNDGDSNDNRTTTANDDLFNTLPASLHTLELSSWKDDQSSHDIPTQLGALRQLRSLTLRGAAWTGALPTELGYLTHLELLYLQGVSIHGSLPSEWGRLTNLQTLFLGANVQWGSLQVSLPNEDDEDDNGDNSTFVANTTTDDTTTTFGPVATRSGHRVNLTGSLEALMGDSNFSWTSIQTVSISDTALSGPIPSEIEQISDTLTTLILNGNYLSGPLPTDLGSLTQLTYLNISDNQFTGPLPAEMGNLTSINTLALQGNHLESPVPPELGDLAAARNGLSLQLHGNNITDDLDPLFCPDTTTNATTTSAPFFWKLSADCGGVNGTNSRVTCSCCTECHVPDTGTFVQQCTSASAFSCVQCGLYRTALTCQNCLYASRYGFVVVDDDVNNDNETLVVNDETLCGEGQCYFEAGQCIDNPNYDDPNVFD